MDDFLKKVKLFLRNLNGTESHAGPAYLVDPNVLDSCGIDSSVYTGFAFGMGIERITQLKYKVNDLRLYSENDVRFLKQFTGSL